MTLASFQRRRIGIHALVLLECIEPALVFRLQAGRMRQ
jgi:hypothetical protein